MSCGVYQILIGDYYYFGSSDDCEKRCVKGHLLSLKRGNHQNKKMQNAFNKYKTFQWEVVVDTEGERGMAYAVEQSYLDSNFGRQHCLNLNSDASKPPSQKGKKLGPLTAETKLKMSEAAKGNTSRKGRKHTDEAKAKMSEAATGKTHTEETKLKISNSKRKKK